MRLRAEEIPGRAGVGDLGGHGFGGVGGLGVGGVFGALAVGLGDAGKESLG